MSCSLASAALMAVCMTLPDLGNAPPFKHRAEPQMTEWGLREVYRDVKIHKALWYQELPIGQYQIAGAYGKVNKLDSLFPGKKLYLFAQSPMGAVYVTPSSFSLVKRWEFD